jgi:hypothetical protein
MGQRYGLASKPSRQQLASRCRALSPTTSASFFMESSERDTFCINWRGALVQTARRTLPFPFFTGLKNGVGSRVSPSRGRGKPLTARLAGRRARRHALAQRGRSIYQPVHSLRMNKKVSFAERAALMNTATAALRDILRIVADEASAMAEVQWRFTTRKPAQKP